MEHELEQIVLPVHAASSQEEEIEVIENENASESVSGYESASSAKVGQTQLLTLQRTSQSIDEFQ